MGDARASTHHGASIQQTTKPAGNYAFLNHSSITLTNNLPPNVDDKLLARHKRKRTSPEDQAILEAAYSRDPKPDKTARLELVSQVALGEKEVQIWFQNRRQTSRRKSRPLLPHEIAQYQLSKSGCNFGETPSGTKPWAEYEENTRSSACMTSSTEEIDFETRSLIAEASIGKAGEIQQTGEFSSSFPLASQTSTKWYDPTSYSDASIESLSSRSQISTYVAAPVEQERSIASLVNRRSAPSLRLNQSAENGAYSLPNAPDMSSNHCLKKSSSLVRLSLSSEGNAKIITKDGSSPSPPRVPPTLWVSTGSGTSVCQLPGASSNTSGSSAFKQIHISSSGRSRDSRAWEFWCDKDARSELEGKAEKDASGSAADAIDLLRSASGRRVLAPLPLKRNFSNPRQASSTKSRFNPKSLQIQRSSTSFGRLERKALNSANAVSKPARKLKTSDSEVFIHVPGNDSDKENWSPESMAQLHNSTQYGPSAEDQGLAKHAAMSNHQHRGPLLSAAQNDENDDPEADPELAAFMHGSGKSTRVSEEEEFDCVQNLLSLSQGNWR